MLDKDRPVHPVSHELPQYTETQPIPAQEETIALGGIRQAITELRLKRAEEKLGKLESHDHVIRHAPVEAQTLRGFGKKFSPPIQAEDKPIGMVQHKAFSHRGNQVAKRRKSQRERYRLEQIYGRPAMVSDSSPSERMSRKERRTLRSAQNTYNASGWRIEDIDRRLQKGVQGDTLPARLRRHRIGNQEEKVDRLRARLAGLPYESPETGTQRKVGRLARRAGKYVGRKLAQRSQGGRIDVDLSRETAPDINQERQYPPRPSKQSKAPQNNRHRRPARTERGRRYQEQQAINRRGVV